MLWREINQRKQRWIVYDEGTHLIPFDKLLAFLQRLWNFHKAGSDSHRWNACRVARTLLVRLGRVVGQRRCQCSCRWRCECGCSHFQISLYFVFPHESTSIFETFFLLLSVFLEWKVFLFRELHCYFKRVLLINFVNIIKNSLLRSAKGARKMNSLHILQLSMNFPHDCHRLMNDTSPWNNFNLEWKRRNNLIANCVRGMCGVSTVINRADGWINRYLIKNRNLSSHTRVFRAIFIFYFLFINSILIAINRFSISYQLSSLTAQWE